MPAPKPREAAVFRRTHGKMRGECMQNFDDVQRAAAFLRKRLGPALSPGQWDAPPVGLVLGTGFSGLAAKLPDQVVVPYADVPGFPLSGVKGHAGAFVWGSFSASCGQGEGPCRPLLVQQGRCHLYEGYSPAQVCMGVRVMAELGVRTLIVTNAAGALNPQFDAGSLMCMTDIINHTGQSPLTGANREEWGERFPDMSAPLDAGLSALALDAARRLGVRLERGIYLGVHGPELESPAQTRMYRQWGADAVGMSSVLEIIAARHRGLHVLGLSCLTNKNLPDCMRPVSLEEVLDVAAKAEKNLARLVRAVVSKL